MGQRMGSKKSMRRKTLVCTTFLYITGGESGIRTRDTFDRIHTFQACSFNHSDTSPHDSPPLPRRDCSAHPEPHPSLAFGASPAAVQTRSRRVCRTRDTFDRIHNSSSTLHPTTRTPLRTTLRHCQGGIVRLIVSLTPYQLRQPSSAIKPDKEAEE